ncbi:MAG: peptide chain release factor N(5)-glutamine methyltransferase [Chloroflexota bacterium]
MSPGIGSLLSGIAARLQGETAALDAQVLLAHILERPRSWIAAHPEIEPEPVQLAALQDALHRLEKGTPLPYVLGHWEFFGLDLRVTPAVLIPRPETELLVERALSWLTAHPSRRRMVDVGTGSGCIAVTLAKRVPDLQALATDISGEALDIARQNAERHGVTERITFVQADLLDIPSDLRPPAFDLLAANLPYIPTRTLHGLAVFNREPSVALDGGADGLSLVQRLLEAAPGQMSRPALALLEIEASQAESVRALAAQALPGSDIQIHQDLAGHDRLLEIRIQAKGLPKRISRSVNY